MRTSSLILLALLSGTGLPSFGQTKCAPTDYACASLEGYQLGQKLRLEKERAQVEQKLINAQAEAVRAQTQQLNVTAAPAPATPAPSPVITLTRDPDFNRLPMPLRVKRAKLVDPQFSKHSDQDIATVLAGLASGISAAPPPVAASFDPEVKPKL
jgi:hypothetical protein